MNLIWLLLRASWLTVAIAGFTGLISGAGSARLIALINGAVSNDGTKTNNLVWGFAGLALIVLFTSIISQVFLIRLAQRAVYDLRMRLSSWILSSPLRHLEELGANRLLATLTDDVQSVSTTVFVIPFLCVDIAIIVGCFIYLGWLSWVALLIIGFFIAVVIFIIQRLLEKGEGFMKLAREEQDRLFKHFRAITEGTKELKLHSARRQAFLREELQPTAESSRYYNVVSLTIFALTSGSGQLFFFIIMGLLVFGLPQVVKMNTPILSGYVLTLTYLMRPVGSIVEMLPSLSRASVALQKIETLGLSLASRSEVSSTALTD